LDWRSAIKGFQAYLKLEKGLSDNSIEAYSRDIDKLQQFSDIQPSKLNPEAFSLNDLRLFINWVNELGMIPSSQARILSGIKSFYKYYLLKILLKIILLNCLNRPKSKESYPIL
jgi:integrase/recombinase XerD